MGLITETSELTVPNQHYGTDSKLIFKITLVFQF